MARPREFDEREALDAAVQCFWSRGYEATSVRELAQGMGITGTSLYNAFGDKRELFRRALDHYLDHSVRERISRLESTQKPGAAICSFFDEIIERSLTDRQRRGCMLVNTALDVAPHDAEFREIVVTELRDIEAFFRRCIELGKNSGELATNQDTTDLARLLLSVLLGIRVLARTRPERSLLEGVARPAMALIGCTVHSLPPHH